MTWHIGLATGCCSEHRVLEVLDMANDAGFAGIELGTPPGHFAPWEPTQVEAVFHKLQTLRCAAISMHAPFGGPLDLAHHDPHQRESAIATLLTSARALKRLGGTILVVHPTDHVRAHHDVGPRLAAAADALRRLTESAGAFGVTIAIETPLPHLIGGHPDEFSRILEHVGPSARVCLDTGHTFLGGFTQRFIELAGDRLAHVHAHDNHGRYDDHLAPGDGALDWSTVRAYLSGVRYSGWMMLELKCAATPMADYFRRARMQLQHLITPIPARVI
jgi:sugar phosphate isomerase/epimerase